MQTAPGSSTETDIHHDSNDFSTKKSEGTVNMQTAPESSTETDIHHDSNDFSTKESEGTVNMETAPESSTETDMLGSIYKLAPFINRAAPFSSILSCSVYKWSCSIFKQLCKTYNNQFYLFKMIVICNCDCVIMKNTKTCISFI